MNRKFLQALLRSLGDLGPQVSDADLIRQFVVGGSESAFAELVRRHGRLVWAVCRHLTRTEADTEDAFQATFLVLLQNARKIRDAAKLSAWLHGVAYRVCAKARQGAQRRSVREQACATAEGNGSVVPDSAWDRALAAVHEEAAKLPDALRVPFVLCCLEGKGVTEAATQLRWKVGTLSARLARAKDAVLARLGARELSFGAVAGVGQALPPAAVVANAAGLAQAGCVVSDSILQLTQGVIGMSMKSVKLLAATVMLTCGLGLGVGTGWMTTADAQAPAKPMANPPAAERRASTDAELLKQTAEHSDDLVKAAQQAAQIQQEKLLADLDVLILAASQNQGEAYVAKTKKWDYDFVVISDMSPTKFVEFLQDRENRGWEYNGQATLRHEGKATGMWTFRRPAQDQSAQGRQAHSYQKTLLDYYRAVQLAPEAKLDDAKSIEAEIKRLQTRLQTLTEKSGRTVLPKESLPLAPDEFAPVLTKMVQKRFPGRTVTIISSANGITVEGEQQVLQWIIGMVNKLVEP